jgi:hypothetical protein
MTMIDLMATLPPEPEVLGRDTADSWDASSMDALIESQDRYQSWASARLAALYQQQGRSHLKVMLSLAGAEHRAPAADREFHAGRLDAYATAHGLSGWYRGTDSHGRSYVQVNKLRSTSDGNVGRYFTHHASSLHDTDGAYWVVDRDTGRTAHRSHSSKEAAEWIAVKESQ